ncbi:MAG: 2-oxoglutarate and iron-dependent oxygenase domain-containing protein [Actinomycetota bacterium]
MTAADHLTVGTVPLIDLDRWRTGDTEARREIERAVDVALSEVGFLIITGHGVPASSIDEVRRTCAEVFALPVERKQHYRQSQGIGGPGWTPIGAEANAYASGQESPPDLKETWTVGPVAPGAVVATSLGVIPVDNVFPSEVPGFEPAVRDYLDAGLRLSAELFELMARAADLPPDTFGRLCGEPLHNLNLTWYPPLVDDAGAVEPEPDQFRIGPHSDFGTITVLHREPSDPPLQVQLPDGTWEDLSHVPDALIVNTGDQLAYWSGGRWRSNPHRIPAPTGEAAREGRLSVVLFLETDVDAVLDPIGRADAEPMDATAFLVDKLIAIDTAV